MKLFDHGLRVKATGLKNIKELYLNHLALEVKLWKEKIFEVKIYSYSRARHWRYHDVCNFIASSERRRCKYLLLLRARLDHIYKEAQGVTLIDRNKLPNYNIFDYNHHWDGTTIRFNEIEDYAQHTVLKANLRFPSLKNITKANHW